LSDVFSGLPPPESNGWLHKDGIYSIDWEDPAQQAQNSIHLRMTAEVKVVRVVKIQLQMVKMKNLKLK
jgi:hypothetical protein